MLAQLLSGSLYSAILFATAELRIADRLAEGPKSVEELGGGDGLRRLMAALAVLGLVMLLDDGRYRATQPLELLREGVDGSMRPLALAGGQPAIVGAWLRAADAVRTGTSGFELANGRKLFDFLDGDAELRELFRGSLRGPDAWDRAIVDKLDLRGRSLAVDVGAGDGRLVKALVAATPGLQGIAFDREHGDFFDKIPEGDVLLMRWVLHDWPDEEALKILRNCRTALRPQGVLYVMERLLDRDPGAALLDFNMLLLTGGRERTEAEYRGLLETAGFRLESVTATQAGLYIMAAR